MAFNFSSSQGSASPTAFEQQREELVREIAVGMEEVLQNINQLNRNLESAIAVGNEFGSVEALWSQFEHFMGRSVDGQGQNPDQNPDQDQDQGQSQGEGEGQEHDQGQDDDKDQSQVKEEE